MAVQRVGGERRDARQKTDSHQTESRARDRNARRQSAGAATSTQRFLPHEATIQELMWASCGALKARRMTSKTACWTLVLHRHPSQRSPRLCSQPAPFRRVAQEQKKHWQHFPRRRGCCRSRRPTCSTRERERHASRAPRRSCCSPQASTAPGQSARTLMPPLSYSTRGVETPCGPIKSTSSSWPVGTDLSQ